jgi:serine/threonine protein kinase
MTCPKCSQEIKEGALFCHNCGAAMETPAPVAPPIAERLAAAWPGWRLVELLGKGSFGEVYRAVREEHGVTASAAIKVISLPQNEAEIATLRSEGMDDQAVRAYYQGVVNDFVNEIKLLESMKGTQNIVSVEDYCVLEKGGSIGWDIFIRMELLTSFIAHSTGKKFSESEVIKLGDDILAALELCAQRRIVHRDIKPENIFISSFGFYKLGDFGIAREMEKTCAILSQKGTYSYIAPEVAAGRDYDATVDIYSLGIILYRLLNNNVLPFLAPDPTAVTFQDKKSALNRRLRGESLPPPAEASPSMAQVILKACAPNPADRYQTPTAFREALAAVAAGSPVPTFVPSASRAFEETVFIPQPTGETTAGSLPAPTPRPKKSKLAPVLVVLLCLVLAGGGAVFALHFGGGEDSSGNEDAQTTAEADTPAPSSDVPVSETFAREDLDDESAASPTPEVVETVNDDDGPENIEDPGPPRYLVPDFTAREFAAVKDDSAFAFLTFIDIPEYNEDYAEGVIIRQSLAPDSEVEDGATITLNTSRGPAPPETIIIKGFSYDTSATSLDLDGTELTNEDIEPLRHMTNLTILRLRGNQISDLTPLMELTNLERLDLGGNQISNLVPLAGLTKLTRLSLRDNQISDLAPLAGLTEMEYIDLQNNNITEVSALSTLTKISSSTGIRLYGNEISQAQINALNAAIRAANDRTTGDVVYMYRNSGNIF